MTKKLKKLLFTLLMIPILPIVCIPDDGVAGNDDSGGNNDNNGNAGNNNDDSNGENNNNVDDSVKDTRVIFKSQKDFDRVISNRINAAVKKNRTDWENDRKKEQMTETERLKTEKTEAENKMNAAIERANNMLLKANVVSKCTELNIVDSDAAFALMDTKDIENNDGNFTGIEESLKNLIADKPWLVRNNSSQRQTGDDQNDNNSLNKNTKRSNVNSILRRMAGY